jgi:hypothetical protein
VNKLIYILGFVFILLSKANAQDGKLLVLKDRGIIVKSYVSGSYINFELSNHQWIKGYVNWVKSDSIQVKMFTLQQTTTVYGTWGEDTLKLGPLTIHINEIISFPHDAGHYQSVFSNGSFLKIGGIGYAGLNIANSLIKKDPVFSSTNITRITGGIVAWLLGRWQSNANPNFRPIGKRFSLETI